MTTPPHYPPAVAGTTFTYGPTRGRKTCRVLFTVLDGPTGDVTHVRYVVQAPPPGTSSLALGTLAQWNALWDHTDNIQPAAYAPPAPNPSPTRHA